MVDFPREPSHLTNHLHSLKCSQLNQIKFHSQNEMETRKREIQGKKLTKESAPTCNFSPCTPPRVTNTPKSSPILRKAPNSIVVQQLAKKQYKRCPKQEVRAPKEEDYRGGCFNVELQPMHTSKRHQHSNKLQKLQQCSKTARCTPTSKALAQMQSNTHETHMSGPITYRR